jgi:hypothetical protein
MGGTSRGSDVGSGGACLSTFKCDIAISADLAETHHNAWICLAHNFYPFRTEKIVLKTFLLVIL